MNIRNHLALRALVFALVGAGALVEVNQLRADPEVRLGVSVGIPLPRGYAEINVGRERYFYHRGMYYRPGPHGYYVVRAPLGARIRELPAHCSRIYVGGLWYWRYGDVYYRQFEDSYVVVDSPVVVSSPTVVAAQPPPPTPVVEQSVWVGKSEYIFKGGQFFRKTPEGLVWVEAPSGAITKVLPADAVSVWYQGVEYYEADEVYFRKTPDGFEVVNAPWKK